MKNITKEELIQKLIEEFCLNLFTVNDKEKNEQIRLINKLKKNY